MVACMAAGSDGQTIDKKNPEKSKILKTDNLPNCVAEKVCTKGI